MTIKDCIMNIPVKPETRISIFGNNFYFYFKIPDNVVTNEEKETLLENVLNNNQYKEISNYNYQVVKNINESYLGIYLK